MKKFKLDKNSKILIVYPKRTIERNLEASARFSAFSAFLNAYSHIDSIGRDDLGTHLTQEFDLIITLGGDGTVLDVARYLVDTPMLSLRLKDDSVGFLCDASINDGIALCLSLFQGDAWIEQRSRIEVRVDAEVVGWPAYNDILVANENPARASRYELQYGHCAEKHCSSGMWVATASGSHAAIRSAGAKPLPDGDARFLLRVRELAYASEPDPMIEMSFNPENSPNVVIYDEYTHVYADGSIWSAHVNKGSTITFAAAHPLNVIHLKKVTL